jgi:hypothetical protein
VSGGRPSRERKAHLNLQLPVLDSKIVLDSLALVVVEPRVSCELQHAKRVPFDVILWVASHRFGGEKDRIRPKT